MDYVILVFDIVLVLLPIQFILTVFSCKKHYFIIDLIIISIIGITIFFLDNGKIIDFLIPYICIRGIIVLISFLTKCINKNLIKIRECSLSHQILVGINIIVNLAFIIRYTYLFAMAYA
jgi:hypothetical protein